MSEYPFEHDGPVYSMSNDKYQVVYYVREGRFYKRWRNRLSRPWGTVPESEVDRGTFLMTIACIERKPRHA